MKTKYIDETQLTDIDVGHWTTTGIDGKGNNWTIDIIYDDHGQAYAWTAVSDIRGNYIEGNNSELEEAFGEACQRLENFYHCNINDESTF